jgi:hypothetical protein
MGRTKSLTALEVKQGDQIQLTDGRWFQVDTVTLEDTTVHLTELNGRSEDLGASQLVYLLGEAA